MRTLQIYSFLLAIFGLSTCTSTNEKKLESEWSELDRVGALSCQLWPIKENELDISHVIAAGEVNGGLVATVRTRNGNTIPAFAETKGSPQINSEDLKTFPIGRNAIVVGLGEWKKQSIAFVVQNKNDRGWIEVRGISDNRIISRMSTPLSDDVSLGKVVPSSKGWWLQLSHGELDSSYVHVTPDVSPNWQFVLSSFQSHTRFATIAVSKENGFSYVVENSKTQDQGRFELTHLETSGKFSNIGNISLPVNGGLESWSAAALKNRVQMALVRGDSMIGQGVVVVASISVGASGPNVEWKKEFPYADVHLGEPVWLSNSHESLLGVIKWIDAEGSLSRIKVEHSKSEILTDVGVFPKGSVLSAGFLFENSSGLGVFRFRENDLWKYKVCRLSL